MNEFFILLKFRIRYYKRLNMILLGNFRPVKFELLITNI